MAISNFSDPLYVDWLTDGNGNKISLPVTGETHVVTNGFFILDYIPNEFNKVTITSPANMVEVKLTRNIGVNTQYKVDYTIGKVYVHSDLEGDTITVNFYKRGIIYYPSSRMTYDGSPSSTVKDKIDSIEATTTADQAEYDAHIAATADRHSTNDIDNDSANVTGTTLTNVIDNIDSRMDSHVAGSAEKHGTNEIDNDSSVTGTTASNALNTLKSQMDTLVVGAANTTIGVFSMSGAGVDTITTTYVTLTYFTDMKIRLNTAGVNTGAATFNMNSLGAKTIKIKKEDGTKVALTGGEMPPVADLVYDGTDFLLLNSAVSEMSASATATAQIIPLSTAAYKSRLSAELRGNTQTPYDSYTKLLMRFEGTDTSTTFVDATGKTVTPSGDAQIDTAQYKFGSSAGLFDGTGDYLTVDASDGSLDLGTSDFCIETWVRFNSVAVTRGIFDFRQSAVDDAAPTLLFSIASGSKFKLQTAGTDRIIGTTVPVVNTWYHVAVVRSGGVTKLYVNGGQEGSSYTDANNYIAVTNINFGAIYDGNNSHNGWLDDLRISVGTPRYTSNFSPLPLQALSTDRIRVLSVGKNLFDKSANGIIEDNRFTTGGALTANAARFISDYIRVEAGATYYRNLKNSDSTDYYVVYDVYKNIVSAVIDAGAYINTITIPANGYYIRICALDTDKDTLMFHKGSVATTYTAYTETTAILPNELKRISSTIYDTWDANLGKHTKNISDWVTLSGNAGTWVFNSDGVGYKNVYSSNIITGSKLSGGNLALKYNNKKLTDTTGLSAADQLYLSAGSANTFNLSIADADSGWDEAWTTGTSFTGMTWGGLIKAYMNGWKLTTADVDVANCVWTGIASGTVKNAGATDYTHVTTTIDTGFTPYTMIYQLATPVVTNYLPNVLTAEPSGTIYCTPYVEDVGLYGTNITIENSAYPIDALESLYKINVSDGSLTPVALSSVTVAAGGLSFTISGATVGEYYLYGYSHKELSTVPDVVYSYSVNMAGAVEGNSKDIANLDNKIETLKVVEKQRIYSAPITIATISSTVTMILFIAPFACDLTGFSLAATNDVAANDTDYWTIVLVDKGSTGSDSNTIASKTTKVTGGTAITAYDAWDIGTLDMTHRRLATGDVIVLTLTKSASAASITSARASLQYTSL